MMMQDKVDVEIRLSLLDLLQDLIPSININDQSKANYVLYYFEFFFNNVVMEEASSMIGNKGMFFEGVIWAPPYYKSQTWVTFPSSTA